jgi:thiol-disulfide isomerase/thioredoxin
MKTNIAAAALLTSFLGFTAASQSMMHKSPELAFQLPGEGDKLLSQYRGKVVALEFILTTCPHCQAASKIMNRMQERYGSKGFQALDVAVDSNADALVENFRKSHEVVFPVGWTPINQMMTYMGFAERPVVPQLVLIDREGNIHYQTTRLGDAESMKEDVIRKRIEELLELHSRLRTLRTVRQQKSSREERMSVPAAESIKGLS